MNSSFSISGNSPDHLCLHKLLPSHKTIPGQRCGCLWRALQLYLLSSAIGFTPRRTPSAMGNCLLDQWAFPSLGKPLSSSLPILCMIFHLLSGKEWRGNNIYTYITAILNILMLLEYTRTFQILLGRLACHGSVSYDQ